jgi:U3 small nucleolar RNA-associated protein 19
MADVPSSIAEVRAAEERLRSDRKHSNELIGLLKLCERASSSSSSSSPAPAVLAAVQACRAAFQVWAMSGELVLRQEEDGEPASGVAEADPLAAYRGWLLRSFRRFVGALRDLLASAKAPLALRMTALDTLVVLAAIEAKHAKGPKGAFHPAALDAAGGAYRAALNALVSSRKAPPEELLSRLRDEHLRHLDASFYLLRHVKRLADQRAPQDTPPPPERILELLKLATPIAADVAPSDASLLSASLVADEASGGGGGARKRKRDDTSGWPPDARKLLERKTHRSAYCKAWRSVLELPLPSQAYRAVLRSLPETVLPHVPRPLAYCDLLSDGYSKGGVEALLCLRGLFVLMTQHNLEYPRFYPRLYMLLTPESLSGPHRASFATEARRFLSSSGLPAYLLAAFSKRLARLALTASPSGAALGCALVYNLMLQHPTARVLVHRKAKGGEGGGDGGDTTAEGEGGEADDDEVAAAAQEDDDEPNDAATAAGDAMTPEEILAAAMAADPFKAEEDDPERSAALHSSLWEVDQLRKHVCPTVASLASLFASPMASTTPPIEIEPLATLTYQSLGQLETRRKLRAVPLATRPPRGLLVDPMDSSLPGATSVKLSAGLGSWR